jgi:hypothetical protein
MRALAGTSAPPFSPSRQEVAATMDEAKDLDLGADAVDEAVAGDEQLAARRAKLWYDTAYLRRFAQQACCLFDAVEQIGGCLR